MNVVILTGLSGSGKSRAVDVLEDIGYYCVDNMPPKLIEKFAEFCTQTGGKITRIAIVVDIRGGDIFDDMFVAIDQMRGFGFRCSIVFLDSDDSVLVGRYKETRRKHPLMSDEAGSDASLEQAIRTERRILESVKQRADFVIDTSLLSVSQLRERIINSFSDEPNAGILVNCMSFGFKFGIPSDADLVFDVRCLPNPFYIEELKEQTGLDPAVRDYVLKFPQATGLFERLTSLVEYLMPLYIEEGKSQLTIAVGCTGGKHRSVVFAELFLKWMRDRQIKSMVNHRDIEKIKH